MKNEDFKAYVSMAMQNNDLTTMRAVVEKELLHYEIFSALDALGLLKTLVFQGGASLRLCRGSDRFSADLGFAGGRDFSADTMAKVKECIETRIGERFGLEVSVKPPKPATEGARIQVDKWTVSIVTSPEQPDMPRQKIKLEIANIPAYTREAMALRVNYPVLEGRSMVLVNTETIEEVLADKIVALPTSISRIENGNPLATPARIRHRDIWDITWLAQHGAKLNCDMVNDKIADYGIQEYPGLLDFAMTAMPDIATGADFRTQMQRLIKASAFERALGFAGYTATMAITVNKHLADLKPELRLASVL